LLRSCVVLSCAFFFQAEDGIRDSSVTGVQTCALPICENGSCTPSARRGVRAKKKRSGRRFPFEKRRPLSVRAAPQTFRGAGDREIGRASCRERVERSVCGGR